METAGNTGHFIAAGQPHMVALDIDGTLVATGMDVPPITTRAVAAARAAGHHVVLATGRSLIGALPVARNLGLDGSWVVVSNGAITARLTPDSPGGYILHKQLTFEVGPVVAFARAHIPDVRIAVEVVGWGYDVTERFAPEEVNGEQRVVDHLDELWAAPVTRAILAGPGVTELAEPLRVLGVTATPNTQNWVDVTAPGLSKATALDQVRQELDIDLAHTVAVGDGLNDAEMLTWAGYGVAMGHAPEQIKARANSVTGTIHEHGAATILQALAASPKQMHAPTPA